MKKILLSLAILAYAGTIIFMTDCTGKDADFKSPDFPVKLTNHDLSVKYIGTEECAVCHIDKYLTWKETGKGRSFHPTDEKDQIEDFSQVKVYDSYLDFYYTAYWQNGKMYQAEYRLKGNDTTHFLAFQVDFVIGSGNKTRTYIHEENGYYYEMPLTWYVEKGIWDLSPGYEDGGNTRFDRPTGDLCIGCHVSKVDFVPRSINRFRELGNGIGCEKCHGPGSLHVDMMREKVVVSDDKGICNPSNLAVKLQFDICRQCHLEGTTIFNPERKFTDFRPGQPLNYFVDVLLPVRGEENDYGFASHAERLQMSRCFMESKDQLTCNTCHDPHKKLGNLIQIYNDKCLTCHQIDQCGVGHGAMTASDNNCVSCHMPKKGTTDIPHVSTSDHFIRNPVATEDEPVNSHSADFEFRNFTSKETINRVLSAAYMDYYETHDRSEKLLKRVEEMLDELDTDQKVKYAYLSSRYDENLMQSLKLEFTSDPMTLFYVAEVNRRAGMPSLKWYESAMKIAPDNNEILLRAANAYLEMGRIQEAKDLYFSIMERKKSEFSAQTGLGYIFMLEGDLKKAKYYLELALHYNPNYYLALENMVDLLMREGQQGKAKEFLQDMNRRFPGVKKYEDLLQSLG